jgi:hypothetical protein
MVSRVRIGARGSGDPGNVSLIPGFETPGRLWAAADPGVRSSGGRRQVVSNGHRLERSKWAWIRQSRWLPTGST